MKNKDLHIDFNKLPEHKAGSELWKNIKKELISSNSGKLINEELKNLPQHKLDNTIWNVIKYKLVRQKAFRIFTYSFVPLVISMALLFIFTDISNNSENSKMEFSNENNILESAQTAEKTSVIGENIDIQKQEIKINGEKPSELKTGKMRLSFIEDNIGIPLTPIQTKSKAVTYHVKEIDNYMKYGDYCKNLGDLIVKSEVSFPFAKSLNGCFDSIRMTSDRKSSFTNSQLSLNYANSIWDNSYPGIYSNIQAIELLYAIEKNNIILETGLSFMFDNENDYVSYTYNEAKLLGKYWDVDSLTYIGRNNKTYFAKSISVYDTIAHNEHVYKDFKYTYLQIPFVIGCKISKGQLSYGLKCGGLLTYKISNNAPEIMIPDIASQDIQITDRKFGERKSCYTKFYSSAFLQYQFSSKLSFQIEPNFQIDLNSRYNHLVLLRYNTWVKAGLIVNF